MPPLAILAAAGIAAAATVYATERARAAAEKAKGAAGGPNMRDTGASGLGGAARRREGLGDDAQGREGVRLDNTLGDQTRGSQMDALEMMRQGALGNTPSVAQLQMKAGLDQAIRNQAAMASGARGQSSLALAQQNAAVNSAMMSQDVAAQQSALRAQEMANNVSQYGGMSTNIRGLDEGRSATQAGLEAQQRGLNDQYQLGMYGQGAGLQQAQVDAATQANQQAIMIWQAKNANDKDARANAQQQTQQSINNGLGAAQGALQTGMTMQQNATNQQNADTAAAKLPPTGAAK